MDNYALVGGTIFDSHTATLIPHQAVHIQGNRIAAVCEPEALPENIARVNVEGRMILPGLIDVHVHSEDWHAPLYLANGVTTVRDVGCELEAVLDRREGWNAQGAAAPRLVCTGPLLDCPGNTWHATTQLVNTPEEARAAVDYLVERGVDQIKCYAFLDLSCFQAIVDQAHRHDKFVVAHLGKQVNAQQAMDAGVNEIEHLSGVGEALWAERNAQGTTWDFYRLWASMDLDRANRLIDLVLEKRTWLAITRLVWERLAYAWDHQLLQHPQMAYIPGPLLAFWEIFSPNNPNRKMPKGVVPPSRTDRSQQVAGMSIFTSELFRRNVPVLIGTDAPFPYLAPGFSYHDEIHTLMECGVSEACALQAATLHGAKALEIEDQVGTIEAGKLADLLIVEGNPLEDMSALQRIETVIRDGRRYEPAALLAQAADYARTAEPSPQRRFNSDY